MFRGAKTFAHDSFFRSMDECAADFSALPHQMRLSSHLCRAAAWKYPSSTHLPWGALGGGTGEVPFVRALLPEGAAHGWTCQSWNHGLLILKTDLLNETYLGSLIHLTKGPIPYTKPLFYFLPLVIFLWSSIFLQLGFSVWSYHPEREW